MSAIRRILCTTNYREYNIIIQIRYLQGIFSFSFELPRIDCILMGLIGVSCTIYHLNVKMQLASKIFFFFFLKLFQTMRGVAISSHAILLSEPFYILIFAPSNILSELYHLEMGDTLSTETLIEALRGG